MLCSAHFSHLVVAALLLPGQSPPIIRVPVRLVVAPVLVLSPAGQVITGLDADKFVLFDDGHPERFQLDAEPEPPSVAMR